MSIRSHDTQELQNIRSKDKYSNLSHRVFFFFCTITILSLTVFSLSLCTTALLPSILSEWICSRTVPALL